MFFRLYILFGTSEDGEDHLSLLLTETLRVLFRGYRRLFWQDALREYQSSAQVFTFVWKFGGLSLVSSRRGKRKKNVTWNFVAKKSGMYCHVWLKGQHENSRLTGSTNITRRSPMHPIPRELKAFQISIYQGKVPQIFFCWILWRSHWLIDHSSIPLWLCQDFRWEQNQRVKEGFSNSVLFVWIVNLAFLLVNSLCMFM